MLKIDNHQNGENITYKIKSVLTEINDRVQITCRKKR
jgi:hypothetical protein